MCVCVCILVCVCVYLGECLLCLFVRFVFYTSVCVCVSLCGVPCINFMCLL